MSRPSASPVAGGGGPAAAPASPRSGLHGAARALLVGVGVVYLAGFGLLTALLAAAAADTVDPDADAALGFAGASLVGGLIVAVIGLTAQRAWAAWLCVALLLAYPILAFSGAIRWLTSMIS